MSTSRTARQRCLFAAVGVALGAAILVTPVQAAMPPCICPESLGESPPAVRHHGDTDDLEEQVNTFIAHIRAFLVLTWVMAGSPYGIIASQQTQETTTAESPPSLVVQAPNNPPTLSANPGGTSPSPRPQAQSVPEPASSVAGLLGAGFLALAAWRKRKAAQRKRAAC